MSILVPLPGHPSYRTLNKAHDTRAFPLLTLPFGQYPSHAILFLFDALCVSASENEKTHDILDEVIVHDTSAPVLAISKLLLNQFDNLVDPSGTGSTW